MQFKLKIPRVLWATKIGDEDWQTAVNQHDALVAVAEAAQETLKWVDTCFAASQQANPNAFNASKLRAALHKVKGE